MPHTIVHARPSSFTSTSSRPSFYFRKAQSDLPRQLQTPFRVSATAEQPESKSAAPVDAASHTASSSNETDEAHSTAPSTPTVTYRAQILHSVTEISRSEWDHFAHAPGHSPFLHHDWIRCLEQSGCASAETGWTPSHIVLRESTSDQLVALAPAYIKQHSLGEFVFDQEWAEAAYAAGINYYPKLLLAVPFTPAADCRILTPPDASSSQRTKILRLFADVLVRISAALPVSSVHVNFCSEDEVTALQSANFLLRKGVQYHFTNYRKGQAAINSLEQRMSQDLFDPYCNSDFFQRGDDADKVAYRDFEDYLSDFKSKRRIKMRRERHIVRNESGLRVDVVRGAAIETSVMEQMFDIYKSTIDKMLYGRQYLNRKFFEMLDESPNFKKHICLVLARNERDGEIVGGTFNVIGAGDDAAFYGRYWGCTKEYRFLHFEACYYAAIEYCIDEGLARMEPGAGGGEFKYMRGFEPCVTMSMHYFRDERLSDAVSRYLDVETIHIEGAVLQMKEKSAIRSRGSPQSTT